MVSAGAAVKRSARLAREFNSAAYDKLGETLKKHKSVSNKRSKEARTTPEVGEEQGVTVPRSDLLRKASVKIKDQGKARQANPRVLQSQRLGQTAISSEVVIDGDIILPKSTTWKSGTGSQTDEKAVCVPYGAGRWNPDPGYEVVCGKTAMLSDVQSDRCEK